MDYTSLTIEQVRSELDRNLADVRATFGPLDQRQLNWRADATSWSVAQCLEHLVNANRGMCAAMTRAGDPAYPRTIWQRLPFLPRWFGRLLVSSQAPTTTRKLKAPRAAQPSASEIDSRIIDRFVESQHEVSALVRVYAGRDPARITMVSPFIRVITYSVLDALRLIAAHERRHYEQARRVTDAPGFPTFP